MFRSFFGRTDEVVELVISIIYLPKTIIEDKKAVPSSSCKGFSSKPKSGNSTNLIVNYSLYSS